MRNTNEKSWSWNMGNEMSFDAMDHLDSEQREAVRLEKKLAARIQNRDCSVLNISQKGVLLESEMPLYFFPIDELIHFELEIDGNWVTIAGFVKWVITHQMHSRIGVFIKRAPEIYLNYLKKIYA
jgi:hypothetical protein